MHLLTTPVVYRILTFQTTPQYTSVVRVLLSLLFTVVMVVHMVMDEFLLHAVTFGLAVYLIATRTLKLIPQQVSDPVARKNVQSVAIFGCCEFSMIKYLTGLSVNNSPNQVSFIFGYLVWLIDEWACAHLTNARHFVGLPFAFLLELHGW